MAALEQTEQADDLRIAAPAPLEFFTQDAISENNQRLLADEKMQWRLLGPLERWKLKRFVGSLAKQLRKDHYLELEAERDQLWARYTALRADYLKTTYLDRATKYAAALELHRVARRGRRVVDQLEQLDPTYQLYEHYRGWLAYQAANRQELKADRKRDRRVRREMRKEARWIKSLLIDVFRKTDGCHYISQRLGDGQKDHRSSKI